MRGRILQQNANWTNWWLGTWLVKFTGSKHVIMWRCWLFPKSSWVSFPCHSWRAVGWVENHDSLQVSDIPWTIYNVNRNEALRLINHRMTIVHTLGMMGGIDRITHLISADHGKTCTVWLLLWVLLKHKFIDTCLSVYVSSVLAGANGANCLWWSSLTVEGPGEGSPHSCCL